MPVQLYYLDEVQELIEKYVESTQFINLIAYPLSPPGRQYGYGSYVAQSNAKPRFEQSKSALKLLIANIDIRLGIRNIDRRLKPAPKPKKLVYIDRVRVVG